MFATLSSAQICAWPLRSLNVAVPEPSASAGPGTSLAPAIVAVSFRPPFDGVSTVLGQGPAGAGMMSPGWAMCPFSTDFVTVILRYGAFADFVLWQIVVFVGFADTAVCATTSPATAKRPTTVAN